MKPPNATSNGNAPSEAALTECVRHLRTIHFLIILSGTFLIVVSLQLPISPVQKSIRYIQEIKVLQKVALSDSPTSEVNILGLIVKGKLNSTPSPNTETLPTLSLLTHKERALSIKWNAVLPLVEAKPSLSSRREVVLQSINVQRPHKLQTIDDFRQLWNLYHDKQYYVHMPLLIASNVLVLDQPQPSDLPSATIQFLQKRGASLRNSGSPLVFDEADFITNFIHEHFPYVPFSNSVVAHYLQDIAGKYNIVLVFRDVGPDIRTPTTVVVPIFAQRTRIQIQSEISSLAKASWSEGLFAQSFSELQAIMPKIEDNMIDTFDFDIVRRVYPIEPQVEKQAINVVGIAINGIQMLSWGPWLIFAIQLYYYILCRQFYQNTSSRRNSLVFPWIGLSRDKLGRTVYFASIIVLPVFTLFIATSALRYSPISQYQVLVYFRYLSVIIASLTARMIILEDWRISGKAETRRERS